MFDCVIFSLMVGITLPTLSIMNRRLPNTGPIMKRLIIKSVNALRLRNQFHRRHLPEL